MQVQALAGEHPIITVFSTESMFWNFAENMELMLSPSALNIHKAMNISQTEWRIALSFGNFGGALTV